MPQRRPLIIYENPSVEKAAETVKLATSQRKTLIVVGNCWVDYRGRATSILKQGERIFIVKEDGSVLIHRSKGYEPVNWQPSGSIFYTTHKDGIMMIRAVRRVPSESITAYFNRLFLVAVLNLIDKGEFSLYASEEDMQRAILLQPSIVEDGLKLITYEKKVEPGFIDIYGIDTKGRMVVIEIKRNTAGKEAVLQLAKYVDSLRNTVNLEVRGILVAPRLAKRVQKMLVTMRLEYKRLDPKKCAEIVRTKETKKLVDFC